MVSIDGARFDYLDRQTLPTLDRLASEGWRADSLQLMFPTKTFATHYAMVTGQYPGHNGVVANHMWDPQRRQAFSRSDPDSVADGYWYGGEPIWNTAEKAGLRAAIYFWPGSEAQIGGWRPSDFKPYAGDTPHDQRVEQILKWLDRPEEQRPDLLTLYFSVVDSVGHARGPDHPAVREAMAEVDRALGKLMDGLQRRGLLGRMHLLVTSDHGMAEIAPERYVLLDEIIPLDRLRVSDWGPAAQLWIEDGGPSARTLLDAINEARHPGIRRAWLRGGGPARYRFDGHRRVPDLTIEAMPGWMISSRARHARVLDDPPAGMHGWDPAWLPMHGLFIAHGPAFAPGQRLPAVRGIDLYALMARLLDIVPAPNDGDAHAFAALLHQPGRIAVREQRWVCEGRPILTRTVGDLGSLHVGAQVYALVRTPGGDPELYADGDVAVRFRGPQLDVTIEGHTWPDCPAVDTGPHLRGPASGD
ncbi:MAG: ectonucleotide pyrophosphatase/phosphodiesterase [Wenzhouxiangellaceae bacterium]